MRSTRIPTTRASATAFLLSLTLATAPSHALKAVISAHLTYILSGAGSSLTYEFLTEHSMLMTRFNILEAPLPVVFKGELGKLTPIYEPKDRCWRFGIVANRFFECFARTVSSCPATDGRWAAFSNGIAGISAFNAVSARTTVICPGPEPSCLEGVDPAFVFLVDLDSGLPAHSSTTESIERIPLMRTERVEGKEYLQNEWAVIEVGRGHAPTVSRSSSATFAVHSRQQVSLLTELATHPTRKRALLIQAPEHVGNTRRPLVRFYSDQVRRARLAAQTPETVAVRAVYRMDGSIESAQTLVGDPGAATGLARAIELDFGDEDRHRTEVYAVFEVGDETRLVSAIPVFLQCCCGAECFPDE